jgi:RNA ligase (TIGR02306 family)
MIRKLASIQMIELLSEIPGADRIEKAQVMGWEVVVRKGEFQEKDLCVFLEVDSLLDPNASWAKFMESKKFRVKTIRLRGVLSQGLALPMSILPEGNYEIGDEVTRRLNVKKYEAPLHDGGASMGMSKGNFPHFVPKTDENRLQSCIKVIHELKNHPYYITLKCDGTSATFSDSEDGFLACSRNWAKKEDGENIYWKMAEKYSLLDKLTRTPFAVQGEICGPKIQRNPLGLKELDLFVFTIYNTETKKRLTFQDTVDFCRKFNLKMVPVIEIGDEFNYTLEQLLDLARGKYKGTNNNREGIVIRSQEFLYSEKLRGPTSFKVINNEYLLRGEK